MKSTSVILWGKSAGRLDSKKNIISISSGDRHCLFATAECVYAVGANDWGQLGLGHNNIVSGIEKIPILPLGEITEVAAGRDHSLVLIDGKVFGFGANNEYQIGPSGNYFFSPKQVIIGNDQIKIKAIGCGSSFSVALDEDCNLYGWGSNEDGQLGKSESTDSVNNPQIIAESVHVFSCGYHHTGIITAENEVLTSGENEFGNLGRSGSCFEFIKCPFDDDFTPKHISCGSQVTFVCDDSKLYVAGSGEKGELGLGPKRLTTNMEFLPLDIDISFESISSGYASSSGICKSSKAVYVWGSSKYRNFGELNQNVYSPSLVHLSHQATKTSNGGWNVIVLLNLENELEKTSLGNLNSARNRRKNIRLSKTLPPLTKSLDKGMLDELRQIVKTQTLKKSGTTFFIEEDVKEQQDNAEAPAEVEVNSNKVRDMVNQDASMKNNLSENVTGGEVLIEKVEENEDLVIQSNTVNIKSVNEDIESASEGVKSVDKADDEEVLLPSSGRTDGQNQEKISKHVSINEEDNTVYSEWGEHSQVKFTPFGSLRNSVRKMFNKNGKNEEVAVPVASGTAEQTPPLNDQTNEINPPTKNSYKSKSKSCLIL